LENITTTNHVKAVGAIQFACSCTCSLWPWLMKQSHVHIPLQKKVGTRSRLWLISNLHTQMV